MIFAKDLILKGLAGLAVVGGGIGGGIYLWNQSQGESLETLTEKVGLNCTSDGNAGTNCTITNTKFNVKQDSTTHEGKSKTDPQPTGTTEGKIKVYTGDEASGYNKGFKFVIEEGDITLNNGGTTPKLEQFETYEITEEGGKYYLTRKEKSSEAKRRLLGIPRDNSCDFPTDTSTVECSLDETKLKAIKFKDKGEGDITVANGDTPTLKLKISKTTEANKADYPLGYKFVLESDKEITFVGTSKTIKANTNTEFKIKESDDHRTLTLEKAWTVTSLAAKVGLTCPAENNTNQECTLSESGNINVKNGDNKYSGLSIVTGNESKKVKYTENVEGFSQGFKFYTEETDGITLDTDKKIEYKGESDNVHYQILKDATDNKWYLTKKST